MNQESEIFKKIIAHSKEYGFVFPSSELYDGLQAVYDYGQNGVEVKNQLKDLWYKSMVQMNEDIVGLDSAIFMHPKIWQASGHVDSFNDPLIDNKDSKKRYRADVLIEDKAAEYEAEGQNDKANALLQKMGELLENENLDGLRELIIEENIKCPLSGSSNWTEVRQFNLMFSTQMGSVSDDSNQIYLRPETAQGIFVNYLNVQKTGRKKIPFGIAQIGKAFRNEIVARQFIFRMREFEQMEMQFFVRPGTEIEWYEAWMEKRMRWHNALGINPENLRMHKHEKLAHYANAASDIEFKFPFGFKEIEGIHSRTDFDLSRHMEYSRKKISYHDPEINQSYTPYVVETSAGADRLFLMLMCHSYTEEQLEDKQRIYLNLPPFLAPIKAAVFPLVKKDGLPEMAMKIVNDLKMDFKVVYEEQGAIGKRYTRQDLIGTPFCITVDHESLENDTVTIRERNSMQQERVKTAALAEIIGNKVNNKQFFQKL
ncbi:MAG: glycine--tRNA ligase [Cytophagales bacterium]